MTASEHHFATLSLPFLSLELFADPTLDSHCLQQMNHLISMAWPLFLDVAEDAQVFDALGVNLRHKVLEIELYWTQNEEMAALNQQYRQKEDPTDVLTFTLLADADEPDLWLSLPVLQLGSIFISVPYAEAACAQNPEQSLHAYLLERFLHGLLHLFGMHHDTMEQYHQVVHIQNRVLSQVFPPS